MKKLYYMRQCTVSRRNQRMITWLPDRFAVKNKHLKLKNDKGEFEDGWYVESVGNLLQPVDYIINSRNDHLHQREASDI